MKVDSRKVEEWSARLERLSKRDGTVAAFCEAEGVSLAMMYYWRRKLGSDEQSGRQGAAPSRAFQAVEVVSATPVLEVRFPRGARLELHGGDLEVVRAVVNELNTGEPSC